MDSLISMCNASDFPFATSAVFVACATTLAGSIKLVKLTNDMLPTSAQSYLQSALHHLAPAWNRRVTVAVNELHDDTSRNQLYDAAEAYLRTKIGPYTQRLKVGKTPRQSGLNVKVEKGQEVLDKFEDMELKWRLMIVSAETQDRKNVVSPGHENRYFELGFSAKFEIGRVLNEYLPFVLAKAKEEEGVKLYTRKCSFGNNESGSGSGGGGGGGGGGGWSAINLDHLATFETLEIEPKMKDAIIDELKGFSGGTECDKKSGKAGKRCYLLYGPPGTGKSSLIAAMANYLKFDVYDLELTSLSSNSELRSSLMSTTNRSIIVIRDVDCCVGMQDRITGTHDQSFEPHNKVSLSCLLSFIDGLWLSCGDERIIVFTTNYSCRLDPAISCPYHMDMHIRMSYSSTQAKVAEVLRKRKNAPIALNLLKRKNMQAHEIEQDRTNELQAVQKKRMNLKCIKQKG